VCRGGHLDIGRDDTNFAESGSCLRQSGYPRAIDAIVIGDQDAHMAKMQQFACV
jgi:hypothetical protein